MIFDHTYDMVDVFPMGNQSLTDIVNLKQLEKVFLIIKATSTPFTVIFIYVQQSGNPFTCMEVSVMYIHGEWKKLRNILFCSKFVIQVHDTFLVSTLHALKF